MTTELHIKFDDGREITLRTPEEASILKQKLEDWLNRGWSPPANLAEGGPNCGGVTVIDTFPYGSSTTYNPNVTGNLPKL